MEGKKIPTGISLDKVRLLYSSNFQGRCLESSRANEITNLSSIKAASDARMLHSAPHAVCIHMSARRLCFLLKTTGRTEVLKSSQRLYEALKHKVCGSERLKHSGYSGGSFSTHVKTNTESVRHENFIDENCQRLHKTLEEVCRFVAAGVVGFSNKVEFTMQLGKAYSFIVIVRSRFHRWAKQRVEFSEKTARSGWSLTHGSYIFTRHI